MKKIYVNVDTNDGDYVGKISDISDEEIQEILPLVEAIKNQKSGDGNFPYGEVFGWKASKIYSNFSGFDIFLDFIPYTEYGFHDIDQIEIYEITNIQKLI